LIKNINQQNSNFKILISTECLRLRRFNIYDIKSSYLSWLNSPLVTRFSNQRFQIHTEETSRKYLHSFQNTVNDFILIEQLVDNIPIGTMTVYRNNHHGTADIGLMIGSQSCWGKGFGYEAWQAMLDCLLSEKGIRKVTGGTARPNQAMVRIMEKSGMKLEAVRARQEIIEGQTIYLLYYARFSEDIA